MKTLLDWLDERTGWRKLKEVILDRHIPKGVDWRYTLGSITLFFFLLQVVTGMLLAMHYSPSPDHAYDSVKYLTDQVPMGRFIRGLHKWGATGMVVSVFLHLLRVFFMGAYKYPREVTWLTGVFLFFFVIGFGFTGYLLPWDQKAFWATTVGAHMVEQVPYFGGALAKIMRGGQDLGAVTLARFYAIHVLVFPFLALLFMGVHLFLVVWHGISAPPERDSALGDRRDHDWKAHLNARYLELKAQGKSFWPYIIFKDTVAITVVFLIVMGLAIWKGVELEDLANPTDTTYNPRPEWYFLSVFQLLKYFPGKWEAFGIVILPLIVVTALVALPFYDRGPRRHPADRKLLVGAGWLAILGVVILTIQGARSPLINPMGEKNPMVMEGKRLYVELHCEYCHTLHGQGGTVGPVLDDVGIRRDRAWLANHFRNPKKISPGTKMPNFNLLDGEVEALVAYMSSLGGGAFTAKAPKLFEDNCATCHKFHGVGEDIAVDLSHIAAVRDSSYIAAYTKDPLKLNPDAAMQGYADQLTPEEIQDLANYLYQQGK
ncbi:MAG TPA: cytochrome b N-terminal domain-containing protein [bacterium]|nr:cytochrome b N-terminal domain-containing protein [bacterium]